MWTERSEEASGRSRPFERPYGQLGSFAQLCAHVVQTHWPRVSEIAAPAPCCCLQRSGQFMSCAPQPARHTRYATQSVDIWHAIASASHAPASAHCVQPLVAPPQTPRLSHDPPPVPLAVLVVVVVVVVVVLEVVVVVVVAAPPWPLPPTEPPPGPLVSPPWPAPPPVPLDASPPPVDVCVPLECVVVVDDVGVPVVCELDDVA